MAGAATHQSVAKAIGTGTTKTSKLCLNDQGGQVMNVTENIAATLRAQANHPPITLESHPADSRIKLNESGTMQTLTSRMGSGGNNVPMIIEEKLLPNSIAYGVCSKNSNAMKSDNPYSGFYEAQTARTLDRNAENATCNQGGIIVMQGSMIGRDSKNGPRGRGINEGVSFTLDTVDRHAVAQPIYCTSKNSYHTKAQENQADTLVATDYKDPPRVNVLNEKAEYILRKLTPAECTRLQGFPSWWCSDLETENPSEADIEFWAEVFEEHRKTVGKSSKPKSRKQIVKWLKNPHSDSAEYKMWGNGVALPNVYFVLSAIVYYSRIV